MTIADPPRFWWLKRLSLAGVVVLLLVGGLRWYWGVAAERALQQTLAELKAAGLDPHIADDEYPDVSPEENAAFAWARVCDEFDKTDRFFWEQKRQSLDHFIHPFKPIYPLPSAPGGVFYPNGPPAPVADNPYEILLPHVELDRTHLQERLDRIIAQARAARRLGQANWPHLTNGPLADYAPLRDAAAELESLGPMRALAMGLAAASEVALYTGDVREAVERWLDLQHLSHTLYQRPGASTTIISAMAVDGIAAAQIASGLPYVILADGQRSESTPSYIKPATVAQLKTVQQRLLETTTLDQALLTALRYEMIRAEETRRDLTDTAPLRVPGALSLSGETGEWLIGPSRDRCRTAFARELLAIHGRAHQRNWRTEARKRHSKVDNFWSLAGGERPKLVQWLAPSTLRTTGLNRLLVFARNRVAARRMTATAIAIRLFEHDQGRRPVRLAELVPKYLARVPYDPFGSGGETILYVHDHGPPRLFSRAEDGVSHGGPPEISSWGLPELLGHRCEKRDAEGQVVGVDAVLLLDVPPPTQEYLDRMRQLLRSEDSPS